MEKDPENIRHLIRLSDLNLHPNVELSQYSGHQNDDEWIDEELIGFQPGFASFVLPEIRHRKAQKIIIATFDATSGSKARLLFETLFFRNGKQSRNLPVQFFEERPVPKKLMIEFAGPPEDEEDTLIERVMHTIIADNIDEPEIAPQLQVEMKIKGKNQRKEYNQFTALVEFQLKRKAFEMLEEHFRHPGSNLCLLIKLNSNNEYRDIFRSDKDLKSNNEWIRVANRCSTILSLKDTEELIQPVEKDLQAEKKMAQVKKQRRLLGWY